MRMMVVVVVMMMVVRQWRWAKRGGRKARGRRRGGDIEVEVEVIGWRQDEMESSLGEVGVSGGACDAATRRRRSTAADLGGAGQVLAEDRGVVVGGLFQLEQWQGGEREGRRRAFTQNLAINVKQGVELRLNRLDLSLHLTDATQHAHVL